MFELLNNQYFVWGTTAMFVFLLTQCLKWAFVKPFTKNLKERQKTVINSVILIIAFGSAVLCEFLYSYFWLNTSIDFGRALSAWGGASGIYGIFERILKSLKGENINIENPFETEEGKATTELLENVTKDGKIDEKDSKIINEFLNNLKKVK